MTEEEEREGNTRPELCTSLGLYSVTLVVTGGGAGGGGESKILILAGCYTIVSAIYFPSHRLRYVECKDPFWSSSFWEERTA